MADHQRSILWFRQDLRLGDNPALCAAIQHGEILPIYILDDENAGRWRMGSASRWWLHHALEKLSDSLDGKLSLYRGDAKVIINELVACFDIKAVYWNRCYEPWRVTRDGEIKALLKKQEIEARSFNGSLLWEPFEILKSDATPYRVFTPYYRHGCLAAAEPNTPLAKPNKVTCFYDKESLSLEELSLLPGHPWHEKLAKHWRIGERAALGALQDFIGNGLNGYKGGRDYPAQARTSRLSPYLHFGQISPRQLWHAIKGVKANDDSAYFLRELGWREFCYYLLYHFPTLPEKNFQEKFDAFPWAENKRGLRAWQKGSTGVPLVDAGMRELWQTGYMHNRLRMVTASFLVKNLLVDWRHGQAWFWDCLVDADLANNAAGWQWVAGSGADAAPYFRIFNPVTQSQKFDREGHYIRHFVPEIAKLPDKYLHAPWQAPADVLKAANVSLGRDYPEPIVDLKSSRAQALEAFRSL